MRFKKGLDVKKRRQSLFNARKKFLYAILCVRAVVRIRRLRFTVEPLKVEEALKDPYRVKVLRKHYFNPTTIGSPVQGMIVVAYFVI
uniref:Uncharacterized protein n=1 Tax=Phlebotomus papatasi TaxID=29031 RepID=A0A1B0DK84_PHLPP